MKPDPTPAIIPPERLPQLFALLRKGSALSFTTGSEAKSVGDAWLDSATWEERERFLLILKRLERSETYVFFLVPIEDGGEEDED